MKRLTDRMLALLCAVCMLCVSACAAEGAGEETELPEEGTGFSDVSENDWFYGPVCFLTEAGILRGFEDGTFRPAATLTNAQLIKLMLAPYLPDAQEPAGERWWQPYGDFGLREGLLTEEDLLLADEPVDRYRAAELLSRLPLLPVAEDRLIEPDLELILGSIADLEEIPEEGLAAVTAVYAAGIMQGYDDGCFHGERILNRAEGAAIVQRLLVPEMRSPKLVFLAPEDWFADALLLGNSHCGGLSMYGELPQADVCFAYGGSVFTGLDGRCRDRYERSFTMRSLLQEKQYAKIILIYGTNEMGYDMDYLRPYFESFLDKLAEAQPDARIWLCTAPPVNPRLAGQDCFTVANCQAVNQLIRSLAEERGLGLIDVYSRFADENGILPADSTGDGIHLTMERYRDWGRFIAASVLEEAG